MITRGKKTYVDASKAELSRILAQIDALSQTEDKVALDKKARILYWTQLLLR